MQAALAFFPKPADNWPFPADSLGFRPLHRTRTRQEPDKRLLMTTGNLAEISDLLYGVASIAAFLNIRPRQAYHLIECMACRHSRSAARSAPAARP